MPSSSRSFTIADAEQVWFLETSNRRWAARQADAGSLSNQITLRDDWQIASRDLESFARAEGWWTPEQARAAGRFDVEAADRSDLLGLVPGDWTELKAQVA